MTAVTTETQLDKSPAGQEVEPETISGGHLVAKALKAEGIDTIFTLCGGHIIDIYDGCIDEASRSSMCARAVAAHAAERIRARDGPARLRGRHCRTAHRRGHRRRECARAESPMLLIGARERSTSTRWALSRNRLTWTDEADHQVRVERRDHERVATWFLAFREALAGAPGPSYLEIGRDILDAKVPLGDAVIPEAGHYRASTKSTGDPNDIDKLAEILIKAERPCVLLGSQVWTARGAEAAQDFVKRLNIPAYMNGAARGTLPPGTRTFHQTRRYAFNNADVIVIVGTPFDFRMGYGKRLSQEATVVQIDMDYKTVGKNRDVSLGLVGDPGAILTAVADAAEGGAAKSAAADREGWLQTLRDEEKKKKEERLPKLMREDAPVHPLRLAHEINEFLTENTMYIGDGGDVVTFSGGVVQPKGPGLWMDPGPLGTLGVGVPFAMVAKLARPDREVVCLFGDGAFSLNGWDFETMVRFDLRSRWSATTRT